MLIRIGQKSDHSFDEPLGLLSDCHRRIQHFLQVLETIAGREAHALTPSERTDLDAARAYFATAAPRHTADEEESLFPRLRASLDPDVRHALEIVSRLELDHEWADQLHAEVDLILRDWLATDTLPAAVQLTLRSLLAELRAIYEPHIACEDHELFPAAARALSPEDLRAIGREMAARRQSGRRPTPADVS